MSDRTRRRLLAVMVLLACAAPAAADALEAPTSAPAAEGPSMPVWVWPVLLLLVCFAIGIVAVLGGVGGAVLFVPIVSGFFPFHLDFVRCTGLLVALSGSVAAGSRLLRSGLASLRLALPVALVTSSAAIVGAMIGLALPDNVVKVLLGLAILGIAAVMILAKSEAHPKAIRADALSAALHIHGIYYERSTEKYVKWRVRRTPLSIVLFVGVGMMAGMFGLGAGWANVPVLNLVMGAPLKISVASSHFLLAVTDSTAAWVYINDGAVLPMIVIPSLIGIMLGSMVGASLLGRVRPKQVRHIVLVILLLAGTRSLLAGLGIV